jgi:hypothetical protein
VTVVRDAPGRARPSLDVSGRMPVGLSDRRDVEPELGRGGLVVDPAIVQRGGDLRSAERGRGQPPVSLVAALAALEMAPSAGEPQLEPLETLGRWRQPRGLEHRTRRHLDPLARSTLDEEMLRAELVEALDQFALLALPLLDRVAVAVLDPSDARTGDDRQVVSTGRADGVDGRRSAPQV